MSTNDGVDRLAVPGSGRRTRARRALEISDELRREIVTGNLAPGTRLPTERELADHFDVSPPTIRESIRVLDAMGLVEIRHGSGSYVTGDPQPFITRSLDTLIQLERVTILEVLEVRHALGLLTARLAVSNASDEDIARLIAAENAFEASAATKPKDQRAVLVFQFFTMLTEATHNPLLVAIETYLSRLLIEFQMRAFADRPPSFWTTWGDDVKDERRRVVHALETRAEAGAIKAMNDYHMKLRALIENDEDIARVRMSDLDLVDTFGRVRRQEGSPN